MAVPNQRDPNDIQLLASLRGDVDDIKKTGVSRWGRIPHVTVDPPSPPDGSIWIRDDLGQLRYRANGATYFAVSGPPAAGRSGYVFNSAVNNACSGNTIAPVAQTIIPGMTSTFLNCVVGDLIRLSTSLGVARTAIAGGFIVQGSATATNASPSVGQAPPTLQAAIGSWVPVTYETWFTVTTAGTVTVSSTHGASNNADYTTLGGYSVQVAERYIQIL